jgi:hypothetical protein
MNTAQQMLVGDLVHGPGPSWTVVVRFADGSIGVLSRTLDQTTAKADFASDWRKPQAGQVALAHSGRVVCTDPNYIREC